MLIEDPNGFVSENGGPFYGATLAGLITLGFDDSTLSKFEKWMRGQGIGKLPNGSVVYFGCDIERFIVGVYKI